MEGGEGYSPSELTFINAVRESQAETNKDTINPVQESQAETNKERLSKIFENAPQADVAVACGKGWMINPQADRTAYFEGVFNPSQLSVLAPEARDTALAAALLLKMGKVERIICAGGRTAGDDGMSEALAMKYFIREVFPDISSEAVQVEEQSYDTGDNATNSMEMGAAKGKAYVLTVEYHQPRTVMLFERIWRKKALKLEDYLGGRLTGEVPDGSFVMVKSDTLVESVLPGHDYRRRALTSRIFESIREPITRLLYKNPKISEFVRRVAQTKRSA